MEKYDYKKESLDELIYRDSSLFLKVFLDLLFMIRVLPDIKVEKKNILSKKLLLNTYDKSIC